MQLDNNTKVILGSIITTLIIIVGAIVFFSGSPTSNTVDSPAGIISDEILIRDSGYNSLGSATAPITIVEFSDLQCPACKDFAPTLKALLTAYPDQVRIVYRHFPLPQHPFARPAALAVEAAGKQGKFWEFHDLAFENQETFSDESWEQYATQLGLDLVQFNESRNSDETKTTVQTDLTAGRDINVTGTPTIFINGMQYQGRSLVDLKAYIDTLLVQLPPATATDSAQAENVEISTPSATQPQ